jgi:hypothetical protein
MKKLKTLIGIALLAFGLTFNSFSQLKEIDFLKGGVDDAETLFNAYLTPYGNIFGANLNAGWYNTAKPHKLGGFDLTLTFNTAWAPSTARMMDLSELGLNASIIGSNEAPTVAGKKTDDRPTLKYSENVPGVGDVTIAEYQVPNGTGVNFVPLPMAQLSIGLPFGTDVTVRYLPSLDFGNTGNIGLWGVGGKHSLLQHIPALRRLPILDITAQGGYTKLSTFANINYGPDKLNPANEFGDPGFPDPQDFLNQKIELVASAWTLNLIFSQTLPVITFYEGIGYSSSTVNLDLIGKYPFPSIATSGTYTGQVVVMQEDVMTDPLDFEMQNSKDLRLNAGFRIKLGVLTIHFDYTKANYSVFTGGIGVSFR